MHKIFKLLLIPFILTPLKALSDSPKESLKFDSSNTVSLAQKRWFGGLEDCNSQKAEPFDIYMLNQSTWILRQSKCDTYEAPFMYLLVGEEKALLLDTGAIDKATESPLAPTIEKILSHIKQSNIPLVILHSHSHSDHVQGDRQFRNRAQTDIVAAEVDAVSDHLGVKSLSESGTILDLGNRALTVLPTPGHHDESITIYDPQDKLLLTGDTLYPGMIMVKNWRQFQSSVALLQNFVSTNKVEFILGGHIEMSSKAGVLYHIGSEYQPDEHSLVLTPKHLNELNDRLQNAKKQTLNFDSFEISPMNGLQKLISGVAGFLMGN